MWIWKSVCCIILSTGFAILSGAISRPVCRKLLTFCFEVICMKPKLKVLFPLLAVSCIWQLEQPIRHGNGPIGLSIPPSITLLLRFFRYGTRIVQRRYGLSIQACFRMKRVMKNLFLFPGLPRQILRQLLFWQSLFPYRQRPMPSAATFPHEEIFPSLVVIRYLKRLQEHLLICQGKVYWFCMVLRERARANLPVNMLGATITGILEAPFLFVQEQAPILSILPALVPMCSVWSFPKGSPCNISAKKPFYLLEQYRFCWFMTMFSMRKHWSNGSHQTECSVMFWLQLSTNTGKHLGKCWMYHRSNRKMLMNWSNSWEVRTLPSITGKHWLTWQRDYRSRLFRYQGLWLMRHAGGVCLRLF